MPPVLWPPLLRRQGSGDLLCSGGIQLTARFHSRKMNTIVASLFCTICSALLRRHLKGFTRKGLSMFGKGWFQPEEASALRKIMQTLLLQLFEEAKPLEGSSAKTTSPEHPLEGTSTEPQRLSTLRNAVDAATTEVNDVAIKAD